MNSDKRRLARFCQRNSNTALSKLHRTSKYIIQADSIYMASKRPYNWLGLLFELRSGE